ncbi:MAG TPA: RidA family protein [Roseomonas sp.]|jgi:enamine deaminase RidA (YjgF/YER057c/UK114 family)
MTEITRLDQNARRSRAVIHGDTVYLAGQTADDRSADITGQTRQVLAKIDEMLAASGTDKSKLLNITIWLADMADFAAMNAVYDAWVVQGSTPARCCGAVTLALPDIRVEIMAVAAR